jgi:hypothetical protein
MVSKRGQRGGRSCPNAERGAGRKIDAFATCQKSCLTAMASIVGVAEEQKSFCFFFGRQKKKLGNCSPPGVLLKPLN